MRAALLLAPAAAMLLGAAPSGIDVSVTVVGLRSSRGQVLACLTARPATFPECKGDREARRLAVPAGSTVQLDFGTVPGGRYAVAIIHDENDNGRLDKRMAMPTEGYGFSRDAPVRFGPPSFAKAAFAVGGGEGAQPIHETITMRYLF